jgi:hypothetical protein
VAHLATMRPGTAQKRSPIVMQGIHATKHPPQARGHINMADQENVTRLQAWHKPEKTPEMQDPISLMLAVSEELQNRCCSED